MTVRQTPVDIPVQPWFADHCFNGKVVLPAVESMRLLTAAIAGSHPEIDVLVMENVRFHKFLEIPGGKTRVAALIECRRHVNDSIHAKLLSRQQFKAMTRLQEHGEIFFPLARAGGKSIAGNIPEAPAGSVAMVSAADIYRELVPFGPAYHTLQETLCISGEAAWGKLQAPAQDAAEGGREIIGSPFPLDGAFHAACVLGQRFADFVPFPVGFDRRIIARPTQPGGRYRTRVVLVSRSAPELVFDLSIFDDQGEIYETVTGLRMRDVSGGRIKPPDWIKGNLEKLSP